MNRAEELLREAAHDIKWLRQKNELLNAKLEGVELMALALTSQRPNHSGMPMQECVVSKIERYLAKHEEVRD